MLSGTPESVLGILRTAHSSAPDPRLQGVLEEFRKHWISLGRRRYPQLQDDLEDAVQTALMLARYAAALSARDVNLVAGVHPSVNRDNLATYFQNAQGLQVRIWDVDILREGNDAVVSYNREDKFKDKSGMAQRIESRRSAELRRGPDGGWNIIALQ